MAPAPPALPPLFHLIARRLPQWRPTTIFDVGANVGQSARDYASAFPRAAIHSFEPHPATHAKLVANTAHLPNVTAHNLGLANRTGVQKMTNHAVSAINHILPDQAAEGTAVRLAKGADVMDKLALTRLSFLKIDTEGHDLEVLKGFGPSLKSVDFIQVEAAMNAYNRSHVAFATLSNHLDRAGFLLFHVLDQVFEFKQGGRPALRRANPVYINTALVDLTGIS